MASTAGILSVVRLRISNDGVRVVSHTSWRSISRGRLQEDGYHCLQCPRITVGKTLVNGRLSGAYLHRRGTTAEKALGSEAEVALECFTLWSDVSGDSLTFRQVLRFPQAPSSIELGAPENINGKMVVPVAYETAGGCGCASYAVIGQSIAGWGVMSPDATVPHAVPCRSTRAFWLPSTSNCSILLGREAHRYLQRSPWVPQAAARHRSA